MISSYFDFSCFIPVSTNKFKEMGIYFNHCYCLHALLGINLSRAGQIALRFATQGKGKRGGFRVIYYYYNEAMSKAGKEIIAGAEQALAYIKGDKTRGRAYRVRTRDIDVKAIREKLHMTQEVFAETFAIPVSTLKKWETNNRVPEGPAKAYLMVIEKNPSAVKKALHSAL